MSSRIWTAATGTSVIPDVSLGAKQTSTNWTPTHGNKDTWGADIDWWWNGKNPEVETAAFSGSNGKSHNENMHLGITSGRYPHRHIRCVSFQYNQNSTAGHGLWLKRYGLIWHKEVPSLPGGMSETFWSSNSLSRRNDYDWHTIRLSWTTEGFDNFLTENHVFVGLALQASTDGGTGTRETALSIRNLRYEWRSMNGQHLIVPPSRPYAERFQSNRIA